MAKRRMISQAIIYDEDFNKLSFEAQNIFVRMLAVSDDFGIVPANEYTLKALINPPAKLTNKLMQLVKEIIDAGLGIIFEYNNKSWFMFKSESFEEINSYVLAKRTKSEYLKLTKEEILSEKFQEILRNSSNSLSTSIERYKNKDISIKIKEREEEFEKFWNLYDKKRGKEKAFYYWQKLTDEEIAKVFEHVPKYVESTEKQFRKDPERYLKYKTFNDEVINGTTKQRPSKGSIQSRLDYKFDPAKVEKRSKELDKLGFD